MPILHGSGNKKLVAIICRWYCPGMEKFISPDPAGFKSGDLNNLRYVKILRLERRILGLLSTSV